MSRNIPGSKRGFGLIGTGINKIMAIFYNGENHTGFADFETLYAAPTATATATVGQRVQDPMGGLWRYCLAGAAITNPLLVAGNYGYPEDCGVGVTAVGSMTIACTGLSVLSSILENQFANSTIIIGAAAANRRFYHIKSNPADDEDDAVMTLYHPVRYAIAGSEWATIVPTPWRNVQPMAGGNVSGVCWPGQPVTSGYYFWGKTRGPIFMVAGTVPGAVARDRYCVIATDGSVIMANESWGASVSDQPAGWLMPQTQGSYGSGDGDQTIWLQLE